MLRTLRLSAIAALGIAAWSPAVASATDFYGPATVTHTKPASCPNYALCMYEGDNFGGSKRVRGSSELNDADWRNNHYEDGSGLNDNGNSVYNASYVYVKRLFRNTSYGSHVLCIAPRTGVRDLDTVEWIDMWGDFPVRDDLQDKISAHKSHNADIDDLHCNWRAR